MLDFTIAHVGVYRHIEKIAQRIPGTWLTFYVSGLRTCRTYLPDGRLIKTDDAKTPPYFSLKCPGMLVDTDFGNGRENWVVMLEGFPLRLADDPNELEINCGSWIRVPFFAELQRTSVPFWQLELEHMKDDFMRPTPVSVCKARLTVMEIVRFFLNQKREAQGETPEERLKRLIDADSSFAKDIGDMCVECHVSPDHLRRLFQRRFQINPQAYRQRKRNAFIMELVASTSSSVKEMSNLAGFKHVSHFCIEFRRQFGMTPKEGIRRFRQRSV